ncbi:dihydrofolate reductase family protein [Aquiflexum sp.]|uniref:dihydrofolate reductase family protein n=1 Tax=Aquiflexum sp. TaxID=1872584 RepID=UPI00359408DD
MRKIVYYVASSLDGFISGHDGDVRGFVEKGDGVDRYVSDLANFDTVIMGRNTYEFGYKYGLKPGQPAYPHMKHYIFSDNLKLKNPDDKVEVKKIDLNEIDLIQNQEGSDIYLCGGGQFAGWLLENQKIDILRIKLNPLILGGGKKLFGNSTKKYSLQLIDTAEYENSLQIMTYHVVY